MPRLIHLNGPPGIGKSTLAQMYVDRHPGVLNLDIDEVRRLIGGWRDNFAQSGQLVRPLALSMATAYLGAGHDVVMPQYLGRLSEIEKFEAAALTSGAEFVEVVLMDTKAESLRRFADRGTAGAQPWHREVQELVDSGGGDVLLADMYDRLTDALQSRLQAAVVPSVGGEIEQTYRALECTLSSAPR